jgi:hypothetical protein
MVTVEIPQEWTLSQVMTWVAVVEENHYHTKLRVSHSQSGNPKDSSSNGGNSSSNNDDSMDWTPSLKVATAKPDANTKKAAWATPEQRAHRRANNLCLRCGASGHYANRCNLAKPTRLANVKTTRINEEASNTAKSDAGYDSEN